MTVRIQSGTTVFVNSGQTVQTPQVQNAGTITNAGTTQQFRSNVASGSGSGLGTAKSFPPTARAAGIGQSAGAARTSPVPFPRASGNGSGLGAARTSPIPFPRASGIGEGFGNAVENPIRNISAGDLFFPKRLQVNANDIQDIRNDKIISLVEVQNAGTVRNEGTTQVSQTPSPPKDGIGEGIGTALAQEKRLKAASGFGEMFGTARKPIPFDPIQQIAGLIRDTNDSRWRYGKPDRIAPIWEYSHNDRINFPNAAFYIYTPAESTVDKFGIEGDSFNQTITIEILIMTLEATETQGYVGDTAEFITQLYNDNTRILCSSIDSVISLPQIYGMNTWDNRQIITSHL